MFQIKISVIIPVYNAETYLLECLDSIVNQTLKDIEIICVNDGSTDNSLSILKEYASKDNRIKIIDKENEGQGYARKVALDIAIGEYILFCDNDDYYPELTVFEELYDYIDKAKVDVVLFNFIECRINRMSYAKNSIYFPKEKKFTYKDIQDFFFSSRVVPWAKIYSKQFLDKYSDWYFPKKTKFEDMPFHFQILIRANLQYFDRYLYVWRISSKSDNSISKIVENRLVDLCKIFKEIYNITKDKINSILFLNYFCSNLFSKLSNYQIKNIEIAKYIIDTIKKFDISDLSECKNKNTIFLIKAGLRMTPENYMEYLNKKNLKNKNKEIAKLKEIRKTRDDRIKTLNEQIKNKNEQLQHKNEQIKEKNEQLQAKNEQIKNRDIAIKQKNSEIQNLHNQNNDLHNQNNDLRNQNNIKEQIIKRLQNSWSYRIGRLFTYPLSILLELYKYISDYNLIKKSNLFDSEYYLANNEDVKNAKMNPIKHYLKFGWKEGRNPSADFNGNEYLNKRPDVRVSGICPLVHYLKFGKEK